MKKYSENHSLLISVDALLEGNGLKINGQHVLMDWHLAELFDANTEKLIRKVRENKSRFPDDFMFVFSAKRFPQTLPSLQRKRKILYAFTWGGIMQAAALFRTKRAAALHVQLVRCYAKGAFDWLFADEK